MSAVSIFVFFFFNDTATTEIYTLSLHDALPISAGPGSRHDRTFACRADDPGAPSRSRHRRTRCKTRPARSWSALGASTRDRKSTRLNSSHANISYAVFCLKKKKKKQVRQ